MPFVAVMLTDLAEINEKQASVIVEGNVKLINMEKQYDFVKARADIYIYIYI